MPRHPVPVPLACACACVCAILSGCSTVGYALKQGFTLIGYLNRAVPLERLERAPPGNSDDHADSEAARNRAFAALVRDIRAFAVGELGLKDTKNYTRFVTLDRDYLALVVSASAPDSFTRHEWNFPVVGRMPYKGFFDADGARREADRLRARGLDVWVREVDAFSTLGWFRDPLYSYMRDYPVHRLADLLIHETLHATVYLKNWAAFNEELAEFVGTEGARLYLASRFGEDSAEYRAMFAGKEDGAAFVACIRELCAELEPIYGDAALTREEKLSRKAETIAAFQKNFAADYETRFHGDGYRGFATLPVNNAWLDLYRLYHGEADYFRERYDASGLPLPAFIAAAARLSGKRDPKEEFAEALNP